MRVRQVLPFAAALLLVALGGCGSTASSSSSASSGAAGTVGTAQAAGLGAPAATVNETDAQKFDPTTSTLHVNDVIQWTNGGALPHNVTFDAHPELTSQLMNQSGTWQVKFTTAGTYQYHCTLHPGMDATVTVS